MAYEVDTATDYIDLFDRLVTFMTSTMTPSGQRWALQRKCGFRSLTVDTYITGGEGIRLAEKTTTNAWVSAAATTTGVITVHFASAINYNYLKITGSSGATYSPSNFTIQYSDNGSTWTTFSTQTGVTWSSLETKVYDISGAGSHVYWRINITANNGASQVSINELSFTKIVDFVEIDYFYPMEVILKGVGLSETEEIFVGFKLNYAEYSDIFNWKIAGFAGYIPNLTFENQPSAIVMGLPLWAGGSIPYWFVVNGQRIIIAAKVETTYQSCYFGKFFPFSRASQWPYPLVVGGMISNGSLTRYSNSSLSIPFRGSRANLQAKFVDGGWTQPATWPYSNSSMMATRDLSGDYPLTPVVMYSSSPDIYGQLDGVYYVPGFGNAVENTVTASGKNHVVLQDVARNGTTDYFAIVLE